MNLELNCQRVCAEQPHSSPSTRLTKVFFVLCFSVILLLNTSGCGAGLFGPKVYKELAEGETPEMKTSPLASLKVDEKFLKPGDQALYGRVVIDGKPAKKGALKVLAVSMKALEDPESVIQLQPGVVYKPGGKLKPELRPRACSVINDEGLYVIKGVQPGEYKVYLGFGTSFADKKERTRSFSDPLISPFVVAVAKGVTMQDIVLEINQ